MRLLLFFPCLFLLQSVSLFINFLLRFLSRSTPSSFLQFSPFFLSCPLFIPLVHLFTYDLKQGPTVDQIIQHRNWVEYIMKWNNMEGCGRDLIWYTIPVLANKNWENPWKRRLSDPLDRKVRFLTFQAFLLSFLLFSLPSAYSFLLFVSLLLHPRFV